MRDRHARGSCLDWPAGSPSGSTLGIEGTEESQAGDSALRPCGGLGSFC